MVSDKYLFSDQGEVEIIREVLNSKKLSGTSDIVGEYEKDLAEYFGSNFAVALSSGSAALHTALAVLDVKSGDEVLVPAIAPIPSVLPILAAGAIPVIVDIQKDTLDFCEEDLVNKISIKTKAAILIPMWGYPIDYTKTLRILNEKNIPLIEDAAQAHGAKLDDKYIGTFGTIGCFSTHDRKTLPTGEGGFILTKDDSIAKRIKKFIKLGGMNGELYGPNYKLSSLAAAIGKNRIKYISERVSKRKLNAMRLLDKISETNIKALEVPVNGESTYYSLVIILPWDRDTNKKFIQELNNMNIPSDKIQYDYDLIFKRGIFKEFYQHCPNSEMFLESMTTIPVHEGLTEDDIDYMAQVIKDSTKKVLSFSTHYDEKHLTSTVFIVTKEEPKRVLLVHHKKFNKWMPPGGHKEFYENPIDTAIREVHEETGIEISNFISPLEDFDSRAKSIPVPRYLLEEKIDPHKNKPAHSHLDMIYVVEVPHQEATHNEDESHDIKWFELRDISQLELFDNVKRVILDILK
jgi:dTDP-4-amino-4,6-dideoxygalactose transaminase/8-oxo-dGTP pyrophosphatase MutT (NUDIX family)|tara:strand:- start:1500 stop:3056 length:1557 start_codon:yes stop_codon:yes gene_type:complete